MIGIVIQYSGVTKVGDTRAGKNLGLTIYKIMTQKFTKTISYMIPHSRATSFIALYRL